MVCVLLSMVCVLLSSIVTIVIYSLGQERTSIYQSEGQIAHFCSEQATNLR